jgi:hypothetical protein
MTIYLSDLVAQISEDVPPVDGVPSNDQYESAVKEAVLAFSERCGVAQVGSLTITAGTDTYDLPADFIEMITLSGFYSHDVEVMITGQGLIPIPYGYRERYAIRGGKITFYPTPSYTMTREFRYKAAWVLTSSDEDYPIEAYATMTERESRIVLIKARAIALTKQANQTTRERYSLGSVTWDGSSNATSLQQDARSASIEFIAECNKYNGAYATT